ncbi:MAG: hypothetical protein EOM20_15405 [Spartobacteria bacterium]|nr:hypothetical protein [Spartobacteria bacterium]
MKKHKHGIVLKGILSIALLAGLYLRGADAGDNLTFAIASDMRYYAGQGAYDTPEYFRGVCESIRATAAIDFMVMTGDIAPPEGVDYTIRTWLGGRVPWYPVVGNHDAVSPDAMATLRRMNQQGTTLPNIVRAGPDHARETIYSFDYGNAHFVVLNVYYGGNSDAEVGGTICPEQLAWLETDLAATDKKHIFVFGHEPAFPQPDMHTGFLRHSGDSLDMYPAQRDAFWQLLQRYGVLAYVCGHSHGYSVTKIDGVWQIDGAHGSGIANLGCGNPSTFILVDIQDGNVYFRTYRDSNDGGPYRLRHYGILRAQPEPAPGDYDGDGQYDKGLYESATGVWRIPLSASAVVTTAVCGGHAMVPVAGDYDGDGRYDRAVYDTSSGYWHIQQSSGGPRQDIYWGRSFTDPCPADFDGDGKTDLAVYYPALGNWYIRESSSGQMRVRNWGWSQATPWPHDYDGDGRADLCVYHVATGNWYIQFSGDNSVAVRNWGWSATRPVPADYDGDQKADIAVYHPATGRWYILPSATQHIRVFELGSSAEIPAPRDYDGDAIADMAVYDPHGDTWRIEPSAPSK